MIKGIVFTVVIKHLSKIKYFYSFLVFIKKVCFDRQSRIIHNKRSKHSRIDLDVTIHFVTMPQPNNCFFPMISIHDSVTLM